MAAMVSEMTMGKKKSTPSTAAYVTARITRELHEKLLIIATETGGDVTSIIDGLIRGPVDAMWRESVARLSKRASGK